MILKKLCVLFLCLQIVDANLSPSDWPNYYDPYGSPHSNDIKVRVVIDGETQTGGMLAAFDQNFNRNTKVS